MLWIFAALAVLAGSLVPVQAGVNTTLRHVSGSPLFAGVVNFSVGWLLLTTYALASRSPLPLGEAMAKAPWWSWLGGTMGAMLVLSGILLSQRLGAASFIACILLGQLASSVVLDHYGLVGFAQHAVTPMRLLGLGLLLVGAYLIRMY